MANEFVARNGIIAKADSSITGTLAVSGNISSGGNTVATQAWVTATALSGFATENYVTTAISNLVDSAPGTLDTLNELAAALGDDPNFATTVTNSIATKLPLAGGSMTGNITWTSTDKGLVWTMNTDGAYIKFFNTGDGDTNSRLEYGTSDNGNEYHRWMISSVEEMNLKADGLRVTNSIWSAGNLVATQAWVGTQGFLVEEADPLFLASAAYNIDQASIDKWNTAFGWGDHSGLYAAASHTHSATDITSGTLASARLSGTYAINVSGSAATLTTARTIALSGDVTGSASFNGSANVTITATVANNSHTHQAEDVTGGVLGNAGKIGLANHPEGGGLFIPSFDNDLAFIQQRGGTVTFYKTTDTTYTAQALTNSGAVSFNPDVPFNGSTNYASATLSSVSEIVVCDIEMPFTLTYGNTFYIDFGNAVWAAKDVSFYAYQTANNAETTYKLVGSAIVNNTQHLKFTSGGYTHATTSGGTAYGYNRLRVVMTNWTNTSPRIAAIGTRYYNSTSLTQTLLSKAGGTLYGDLSFNDTNTVLKEGSGNAVRIQTNTGYVDIGSMNSSWVHFQADRSVYMWANGGNFSFDAHVLPYNNTKALGTSAARWSTVYGTNGDFSGALYVGTTIVDPSGVSGFAAGHIAEGTTGFSAPGIAIGSTTGQHGAIVYGSNTMYFGTENGSDNTLNTRMTLNSSGTLNVTGNITIGGVNVATTTFASDEAAAVQDNLDSLVGSLGTAAYTASTAYAPASHTHDDRYYTESEVDNLLGAKQGTGNYSTFQDDVYLNESADTDSFLNELYNQFNAFRNNYVVLKCAWSYAGNSDLDTGTHGVIELAGCIVECWGNTNAKHVRITRPTTGAGASVDMLVYNSQYTGYSPGWTRIWNDRNDGAGSGLDADTLDGLQASEFGSAGDTAKGVEAFGWGDHAAAGYLTSESDTLATVTARGNTTNGSINVNGDILLTGTATTTNQGRMIDFTGFDKEGTTDFSDRAYIQHTVNTGGHSGSVLVISSQNDSGDGIAFLTNASSKLKHNSNNIATENWVAAQGYLTSLPAHTHPISEIDGLQDELDGKQPAGSYLTSYTETDTLNSVLVRGNSSGTQMVLTATDVALKAQSNGSTGWRGRIGSFNSTADKSSFLGTYNGRPGVFGHNNALTAWDDLWVNTLGTNGQGNVYLSWNTYVKGSSSDTNYTLWHSGNDGSGSGLDADTVDGIQASSFLRSDANDTASGNLYFSSSYNRFNTGNSNNTSTADTVGVHLHQSGYTDGRWTTRLRKYDHGGGVPLYIDNSAATANVFTAAARFGTYSGNGYTFEVFGAARINGDLASSGQINASGGNSSQWNAAYSWGDHTGLYGSAGDTAKGVEAFGWGDHSVAGYITDGNTNWDNTYGFITASASITGNAATATKLATARSIALAGDVTGSANFDGSANISITATVADDSHTHDGRYYTESESDARFVNVTGDTVTGNLAVSGASLSVTSTAAGSEAFYVDGVNGRLFTISDDLSDSLFSVNTISGLPVIEAFADNTVKIGPFSNPVTISSAGTLSIGGLQAATQSYVDTAISNLIGGAPGALDTLNELAAAINDDASYASTITTALGTKAPLASPALTGTPTAPTAATATNTTQIATTAFVKAQGYLTSLGFNYGTGVTANYVVQRDANGYIYANYVNLAISETENPTVNSFIVSNGDGWTRKASVAHIKSTLGLGSAAYTASTDYAAASHTHDYLPLAGGNIGGNTSINGDLDVGAIGKTSDTVVRSLADQSYKAGFEAYGNGQGTGYVYVGQSADYGGGFSYNGDNSPGFISGETADNITFFRRQAGANTEVFHYAYSNNDVYFNGAVVASGSNSNNWNTAYGWGDHSTRGYLTSVTNISGYAGTLVGEDNRTISPSELTAGQLKFGFTSWNNNNTSPWADFIHMRGYTDSSGGSDNLVMFKKSGIGMRIWQQSWGSSTAYSSYVDVWTSGDFTSTSISNWNTAYSWGNHAGLYAAASHTHSYLPLSGGTLTGALTTRNIASSEDRLYDIGAPDNRYRVIFCETLDSAGLHESNLASKKTGFYETGTILVWKDGEAVPCSKEADHMKIGIAVYGNPSPLVQGAEPVLVTGDVLEGDYLITSEVVGHAKAVSRSYVIENQLLDCVIGKALETASGESHLVKTWVTI